MAITPLTLEINQHDDKRFYFNLVDENNDPILIDDLTDVVFSIANSVSSDSLITKKFSLGEVFKSDTNQVFTQISYLESGALTSGEKYCELRVISSGPFHRTAGAGVFTVNDTQIGDT